MADQKSVKNQRLAAAAAVLLGLAAALVIAEAGLYLFGYRRPPPGANFEVQFLDMYDRAFRRTAHGGVAVYESARPRMRPSRFPVLKPQGRKRIFLVGDSTAWGFPLDILESKLKEVLPGTEFEAINCGVGGADAYRAMLMGREVIGYAPDLVVVIVGNTESIGLRRINPWKFRGPLSRSAVFRLLCDLVSPAVSVSNREESERYFSDAMSRLIDASAARGIPLLLCTVPANHRDNHFAEDGIGLDPDFLALLEALRLRKPGEAARHLEVLAERHPKSAFLEHYRGRAAELRGNPAAAARHYALAMELDRHPVVCPGSRNEIIRGLAARHGLPLADIAQRFLDSAPHGIPGFDLFQDNCHPWTPAYGLYADALIDAVHGFDCAWGAPILAPCGDWRMKDLPRTTYDSLAGPVARQRVQTGVKDALVSALAMALGLSGDGETQYRHRVFQYLELVLEQSPGTLPTLDSRRAELQAGLAEKEWLSGLAAVLQRDRPWGRFLAYTGEALRRAGRPVAARRMLDQAVALNPEDALARRFRGWTYLGLGQHREAAADFAVARRLDPPQEAGVLGFRGSSPWLLGSRIRSFWARGENGLPEGGLLLLKRMGRAQPPRTGPASGN